MTRKASEPARKVRWTVPGVDTSVIEWLDKQENLSESLRLLIRESIQRDGYIDVAFKPVDQLPRRGRPPADDSQAHHSQQGEKTEADEQPAQQVPERDDEAFAEVEPAEQIVLVEPEKLSVQRESPTGQVDINDIFGHGG